MAGPLTPSMLLHLKEADGSPDVRVHTLIFPNGTLTNNGDGTATFTPSGGMEIGGTVTSGTAGRVLFVGAGPVLDDDGSLVRDLTTGALSIGQPADPTNKYVRLYHDGSNGWIEHATGILVFGTTCQFQQQVRLAAGAKPADGVAYLINSNGVVVGSAKRFGISSSTAAEDDTPDVAFTRIAASVWGCTNGSTGGAQLEFPQVADVGTPSTNSARIGAEDVAGTAEMIVADEAGTETQISPHAADAPAGMYDGDATNQIMDCVLRSVSPVVGRAEFVQVTRTARWVEQILDAVASNNFAGLRATLLALPVSKRHCHRTETIEQYATRTNRRKVRRPWAEVQAAHQARYDEQRAADVAAHAKWVTDRNAHETARAAEIAAHDAWGKGDQKEPAPRVRPPFATPAPTVRPAKDIRKPPTKWLQDRGVSG